MLKIGKAVVSMNFISLLEESKKKEQQVIELMNVQLFRANANIVQEKDSSFNFQFVVDSLFPSTGEESNTHIRINTIVLRDINVKYSSKVSKEQFDLNKFNISVRHLKVDNDEISADIRSCDFVEHKHDLFVKEFSTLLSMNKTEYEIHDFVLKTLKTDIDIKSLAYNSKEKSIAADIKKARIVPTEFSGIVPKLKQYDIVARINDSQFSGSKDSWQIKNLDLSTNNGIQLKATGGVEGKNIKADIENVTVTPKSLQWISRQVKIDKGLYDVLSNLGKIEYRGQVNLISDKKEKDAKINGTLSTEAGNILLDGDINRYKEFRGKIKSSQINLGKILGESKIGNTSIDITADGHFIEGRKIPEGAVQGEIGFFEYAGYKYTNINIDGQSLNGGFDGVFTIDDPNMSLNFEGNITNNGIINAIAHINIATRKPAIVGIIGKEAPDSVNLKITSDFVGQDINTIAGTVKIDSGYVANDKLKYAFSNYSLSISHYNDGNSDIILDTDFIDATIKGKINVGTIVESFKNQIADNIPSLLDREDLKNKTNNFDFSFTITDNQLLQYLSKKDLSLGGPVSIDGNINDDTHTFYTYVFAPSVSLDETQFYNTTLNIQNSVGRTNIAGSVICDKDDKMTLLELNSDIHDDQINAKLDWGNNEEDKDDIHGTLVAEAHFSDSLEKKNVHIKLQPSQLSFNETAWYINPATIDILGKEISCKDFEVYCSDQFLKLEGTVSENADDTLNVAFKGFDLKYITDLINFHVVDLDGNVSGTATVSNIYDTPNVSANLTVDDMLFEKGPLGKGKINVTWDNEIKGVRLNATITDNNLATNSWPKTRTTTVNGRYIPGIGEAHDDIRLRIGADNTNAKFIEGFLGSIFKDVRGSVNGTLDIATNVEDGAINLLGTLSPGLDFILKANNTRYFLDPKDSIRFVPDRFRFDNIHIHDIRDKEGVVNGYVTHHKLRNFGLNFGIDINDITLYNEQEFNSDKFKATVFGSGRFNIRGRDGHSIFITADVTPNKGSAFYYDAASPDAVGSNSFITFSEREEPTINAEYTDTIFNVVRKKKPLKPVNEYTTDVYLDMNIHLNNDIAICLKMDNYDDGYINTYGHGELLAHYHDKSPFTLNGTYHIDGGKYRLYLQDIIYRDLDLQQGSNAVFNGDPFDANIHLICWHTLNSVPLRDLTSSATFLKNNKVKVICALDISGKLGNMNFGFNLQLPNVSDETRQIVRSLISTEEEMNKQMIYLLGVGRFFASEYSRATGENNGTGQAMNSLLSSTISGQVNQLLDNVMGSNSKWNFGTGLSTGEKGWNELDVEGTLSGSLLNDRLLLNGNFGYRDNALTNKGNIIGDFDVKYRLTENGNLYLKAYNQTNDKYFTKATLNTQGIGISYQKDFDTWRDLLRRNKNKTAKQQESLTVETDTTSNQTNNE